MDSGPIRRLSLEERRANQPVQEQPIIKSPISPRNLRLMEEERNGRVRRWSLEEFRGARKHPSTPVMQYAMQPVPVTQIQPGVQTICPVQPVQVLQTPGKFRSGSFETSLVEPSVVQSQVQYPQQPAMEPNQWQDEHSALHISPTYEPVYQVVRTQYNQPYQSVPSGQNSLQQVYVTQSLKPGYTSVPMQSYPAQTLPGQVLQPVVEDHLHKPLQAVPPMQFHMQDLYSLQQTPVTHVVQHIEAPTVPSYSEIDTPKKKIADVNKLRSPEEPVRVRKVSFQDEANEESNVDDTYVGLKRVRPKHSKSVDTDESHEPKPSKGILQRKSRSLSESNATGKVRRNSICPMTAYNLR